MGILKDVNKAIALAKDAKMEINKFKSESLARKSSAATLQFPIIISRSVNMDTAQAVSKALERQYAIFVQIVLSLNPFLDLKKDKDMAGYLNKIHQNNPSPLDLLESCTNVYSDEAYNVHLLMSINEGCNGPVLRSNKEQMFCVEDHLNKNKLNDLYKPANITLPVAESSLNYFCKKNGIEVITEAKKNNNNQRRGNNNDAVLNFQKAKHKDDVEFRNKKYDNDVEFRDKKYSDDVDFRDKKYDNDVEFRDKKYKDDVEFRDKKYSDDVEFRDKKYSDDVEFRDKKHAEDIAMQQAKLKADLDRAEAEFRSKAMVKLSDNDVKKSNELVPTTLSVTMHVKDGQSFGGVQNFVIGVKGLMHPVNSNEVINNLLDGYKSGNKFFNFIRFTTGEISFIKDFLLNINELKEDAINAHSKSNSHWWTTLKRRKTLAKAKNAFSRGNNKLLPNASIVCSMEEIVEINEVYGLDLMVPANVKKIMNRYFLLGFVIVDESQELCHFIFDGESNYQVVTFKGLERENNNKNDFKEIYKMINSGRL